MSNESVTARPVLPPLPESLTRSRKKKIYALSDKELTQMASDAKAYADKVLGDIPRGQKCKIWVPIFLDALRRCANVSMACRAAGVARQTAEMRRRTHSDFRAAWDHALREGWEVFEYTGWQRAMMGTEKPIWMKDENGKPTMVGTEKVWHDPLYIKFLQANLPEKYGRNAAEDNPATIAPTINAQNVVFNIPSNGRADRVHEQKATEKVIEAETVD